MNITVFCASSDAVSTEFRENAFKLGEWIAQNSHTLVYGGATGGLMDEVARGAKGTDIIGIIPDSIVELGRTSTLPTQLFRVSDLAERKQMLREYADVFIALPGGFGTLDELFDAISACKLGEIDAPAIIYNMNGFYDHLIEHIHHFTNIGLGKPVDETCYRIANSLDEIEQFLASL